MPDSKAAITRNFDHHRPAQVVNPDLALAELRNECPVAWTEAHGGFYVVTRYKDVEGVIRNSRDFSSRGGSSIPPPPYGESALAHFDAPVHTSYRRAMNSPFTREAVDTYFRPRAEHWTDVFLDRIIEAGSCDMMYDLSVAVPTAVTMEWLGWSRREEWWKFGKAWHDLIGKSLDSEDFRNASAAVAAFDARIAEEIADRRDNPRDDGIGYVAGLVIDGSPIPDRYALSLIRLLVGAGVDTTTSLIGAALAHLHFHPRDKARLMAEPELWPVATEEFLRRYPPVRNVVRRTANAMEVGGCPIAKDERVLLSVASANQDSAAFAEPLDFRIDRSPNRHLSFGGGIHMCLGMHLARCEFEVVMRRVLERMPDYRFIEDELVPYSRQSSVNGFLKASATFTPGKRVLPDCNDAAGYSYKL